jgi:hypothetical protein
MTLLGHVCELPLSAMVASHAHADESEAPDQHSHESEIACDAVLGVRPSPHAGVTVGLDVTAQSHPFFGTIHLYAVSTAVHESDAVPRRLPLFLLHAALLI